MEVCIDNDGVLKMSHGYGYARQRCALYDQRWCMTACPHFREPCIQDGEVKIMICLDTTLSCSESEFRDERPEKGYEMESLDIPTTDEGPMVLYGFFLSMPVFGPYREDDERCGTDVRYLNLDITEVY